MKQTLLGLLLSGQDYLSGEELGARLGISRAAVWKQIQALKERGIQVEAVQNRGYRLLPGQDILAEEIWFRRRKTNVLGSQMRILPQVDSTNHVLRLWAEEGAAEGAVVVAEQQTAGRGRRGRTWVSEAGKGLYFSVLFRPDFPPTQAAALTLCCGLAVAKALRRMGIDAFVKWPNDVLVKEKKICGILTEMRAEMEAIQYVIAGIGMNVGQETFPEAVADTATSIFLEKGVSVCRMDVLEQVLEMLESVYTQYQKGGLAAIREEYLSLSATIGQDIWVLGKEPFAARALDLGPEGELVVEKEDGSCMMVVSQEVSIRRRPSGKESAGSSQF